MDSYKGLYYRKLLGIMMPNRETCQPTSREMGPKTSCGNDWFFGSSLGDLGNEKNRNGFEWSNIHLNLNMYIYIENHQQREIWRQKQDFESTSDVIETKS